MRKRRPDSTNHAVARLSCVRCGWGGFARGKWVDTFEHIQCRSDPPLTLHSIVILCVFMWQLFRWCGVGGVTLLGRVHFSSYFYPFSLLVPSPYHELCYGLCLRSSIRLIVSTQTLQQLFGEKTSALQVISSASVNKIQSLLFTTD